MKRRNRNLFEEAKSFITEEDLETLNETTVADSAAERAKTGQSRWFQEVPEDELENLSDAQKQIISILNAPKNDYEPGVIEKVLDRALQVSEFALSRGRGPKGCLNVCFVGEPGSGKTGRITDWAERNDINLVFAQAATMDAADLGGIAIPNKEGTKAIRIGSSELDELDDVPRSVLFLDEVNRAANDVKGTLLTLIQDHVIIDPTVPGRRRVLNNFLFTIAAINPPDEDATAEEMGSALWGRFIRKVVESEPNVTKKWLLKEIATTYDFALETENEDMIRECLRKINLINALFDNPSFKFDTKEERAKNSETNGGTGTATNARSLTNLINYCDGTKADFLAKWDEVCNPYTYDMAKRCLQGYVDPNLRKVQYKVNDIFSKGIPKPGKSVFSANSEEHAAEKAIENGDLDAIIDLFG